MGIISGWMGHATNEAVDDAKKIFGEMLVRDDITLVWFCRRI